MTDQPVDATKPDPATVRSPPRWRRALVATLVIAGCILAPVSVVGVWLDGTLLNTDHYVSTVGPLARNSAIQDAIASRVTTEIVEHTALERRVKSALPSKAAFLAPYLATGLEQLVHSLTLRTVQSSTFATLWETLNRRAHAQVVAVLKGQTKGVKLKNGQVVLDLAPVVNAVDTALKQVGVGSLRTETSSRKDELVLFSSTELRHTQRAIQLLDDLATVLPILTVVLLAAAIVLSPARRRTILRGALGIAFGMALLLVALNLGRTVYLDALPAGVNEAAARAVYDQVLTFLELALRTFFALAVIAALGAWLAGPGRLATRLRAGWRSLVRRTPEQTWVPPAVAGLAQRYRTSLRVSTIGVGLAVLTVLSAPGPVAVLVIAGLVALTLAGVELVARGAPQPAEPRG